MGAKREVWVIEHNDGGEWTPCEDEWPLEQDHAEDIMVEYKRIHPDESYRVVQYVEPAAARREGVIEGLERALTLFPNAHAVTQWDPQDAIRDTLERLRAEQKEG